MISESQLSEQLYIFQQRLAKQCSLWPTKYLYSDSTSTFNETVSMHSNPPTSFHQILSQIFPVPQGGIVDLPLA